MKSFALKTSSRLLKSHSFCWRFRACARRVMSGAALVLAALGAGEVGGQTRLSAPVQTAWRAVHRTEQQTQWQAVTRRRNTVTRKIHAQTNAFVELGSGLNVRDAAGQQVAAEASFQFTATGAEARGTAHQVIAPADVWLGEGIPVIQPDGQRLVFQPPGLDYYDPVDGRSVLQAAVTNAVGWLTASNEIIYSNCFTRLKASIRVRNTAAGLTHDGLLHERPPDPTALGLSSEARLEMLTEQMQGSVPEARPRFLRRETDAQKIATLFEPDFMDAELVYAGMKMANGQAFSTARGTNGISVLPRPVGKSFETIDQRRILIEAIEHRQAAPAWQLLPLATNTLNQTSAAVGETGFSPAWLAQVGRRLPRLASADAVAENIAKLASIRRVEGRGLGEQALLTATTGAGGQRLRRSCSITSWSIRPA